MFYYVIYNSTVLNYSNNNKNLNTFIYGTILYILSHGLINSYDNKFAHYIKTYFWLIFAIDIASIYYMHTYINNDLESDANSLKSLLDAFKLTKYEKEKEKDSEIKGEIKKDSLDESKINIKKDDSNEKGTPYNKQKNQSENNSHNNEPLPFQFNENNNISMLDDNNTDINDNNDNDNNDNDNNESDPDNMFDQMSDEGSDIDLDNFEMTLNE